MKRSRTFVYWAAALLTLPLLAADVKQSSSSTGAPPTNSVDSPAMGYVVRGETPELRAMLGVPGSARFSEAIALPDGTVSAEVAPGHRWVLAIRTQDVVSFLPDSASMISLGASGVPAAWAFSPTGSRVALSYPDQGLVMLVSGLPGTPKVESTLPIAQMDSFAVADSGAFVYALGNRILNSEGGLIYDGSGLMAFEPGRDAVVLFDGSNGNLVEVEIGSGSTRVIVAAIAAPDRLFAGSDRVYAGDSVAGTVSLIEYADGSVVTQNVPVKKIAPSGMAGTVMVGFDSDGPAWLVNSQGVSFVPAIVKQSVQ